MHALIYYPLITTIIYLATTAAFFIASILLPTVPILAFIARLLSAYASLIACSSYGTIASATLRCFNLHHAYAQWTTGKCFKWVCRYTLGVRFEILDDGEKILYSNRPIVIVGNHQSALDVVFLGCIWPTHCSVTAKKSLRIVPFLGWFMTLSGSVFIDRAHRSEATKALSGAADAMKTLKQSVFMFPEGTRSYAQEPMLLPFKKGAFHLAVQAGVDIVPVVAENYSRVLDMKAKHFNPGVIRVKVLQPISTAGMTTADVDKLTQDTRNKMLETLVELAAQPESTSKAKKVS
jgi:lysophosphatidate acyltransferase